MLIELQWHIDNNRVIWFEVSVVVWFFFLCLFGAFLSFFFKTPCVILNNGLLCFRQ